MQRIVFLVALVLVAAPLYVPTADASVPPLPVKPIQLQRNNTTIHQVYDNPGFHVDGMSENCVKERTFCFGPAGPWGYERPGWYGFELNVTWVNATVWQEKDTLFEYGPVRVNVLGGPVYVCPDRCIVEDNVQVHVNTTGFLMYVAGQDMNYVHWEFEYNSTNESVRYRIY